MKSGDIANYVVAYGSAAAVAYVWERTNSLDAASWTRPSAKARTTFAKKNSEIVMLCSNFSWKERERREKRAASCVTFVARMLEEDVDVMLIYSLYICISFSKWSPIFIIITIIITIALILVLLVLACILGDSCGKTTKMVMIMSLHAKPGKIYYTTYNSPLFCQRGKAHTHS